MEDSKKIEVVLFYNFDDDEVLIRNCKLLSCERDVAPIYPDDPCIPYSKRLLTLSSCSTCVRTTGGSHIDPTE